MPREPAGREARRRLHDAGAPRDAQREARGAPLRVADVALFCGERSGGIRTYLEAKAAWAQRSGLIAHHVIVPGRRERHEAGRHELRSVRLAAANDPRLWQPLLRSWMHHAYRDADAIMSAVDPRADCGRDATIPLRFGIDGAFVPQPDVRRQDHVLYVGRLAREKGVIELLHAAARSPEPWQLKLVGEGPIEQSLRRLADRLGIAERVRLYPFIADRGRLAHWYASARVVVMPGVHETFGLAAFEAAATGTPVVTCSTAPCAALMRTLVRTYEPGDIDGLLAAITQARDARPRDGAGEALGRRCSWGAAFAAELIAFERLVRGRDRPMAIAA